VVDTLGNAMHFAYDDAGNQTSVSDANGNSMAYVYDVLNRQSQVVYPDATFEQTTYVNLPRFCGHPRRRENAPGDVHVTTEAKSVYG